MAYHQNARLTVHSREQLSRCVLEQGSTLKAAAADFSVSAKTAAKWAHRYRESGSAGLKDLSPRLHRSLRKTSSSLLEMVLVLRRQRWNGWRIAHELELSRATVSRILRRAGMNRLRSLDPPPPVVRYEHKHPGDLIHFDIKRLARISFAAILPDQSHRSAIRFFLMARAHFNRFGITLHLQESQREWLDEFDQHKSETLMKNSMPTFLEIFEPLVPQALPILQ